MPVSKRYKIAEFPYSIWSQEVTPDRWISIGSFINFWDEYPRLVKPYLPSKLGGFAPGSSFSIGRHFNLTFFCFSVLFFLSFWFALLVLSSAFVFVFVLPLPFLFIFWLELLKCNIIKSHDLLVSKLTYCLIGGFLCFFWIGGSLIIIVSQFSFSWMSFSSMFFLKLNNNL